MAAMHPMEPAAATEVVSLHMHEMTSMQVETQAHIPAYAAWMAEQDLRGVYRYEETKREASLEDARGLAIEAAIKAGADPAQVRITSLSEVPMTYVPGGGCRVLVKAAGPLATAG